MEWGTVATWVSGIGSLAACCVALFISERGRRIALDGYVGKRILIGGGWPKTNVLVISVTNVGPRKAKITNVGMTIGGRRSGRAAIISVGFQNPAHPQITSDKMPISLEDGESANWRINLGDDDAWINELVRGGFVKSWKDVDSLRFVIYTSQGFHKVIRPDLSLRQQLHDLIKESIDGQTNSRDERRTH